MIPAYGGGGGAGGVRDRTCGMYWCYQCDRALRIISYPAADVFCPRCFGRFLHEIDPPPGFFPRHFHPVQYDGHQRQWVVHGGGAPAAPGRAFRQPAPVTAPVRVPAPAPPRRRLPSPPPPPVSWRPSTPPATNPGDYFTRSDLNSHVEELTQNDRPGPAPASASASAIDALPTVRITDAHLSDGSQCPVCKEDFELGEAARQLPCKHVYHSNCIVPWLGLHNSCPVCRSQLPGAASTTTRHARRGSTGSNMSMDREREPPTIATWGPLTWMWPPRGMEEPDDEWGEYRRRGRRPEQGDAGGNDLSALQSFVLAATCVFFFSFFV